MNFLKGVFSRCHSFQNTSLPGRINDFDRCFQAFKLSIDVQLGALELVTPVVLAKTQNNLEVLSAPHGEGKAENIYHCPNVCESCRQFIRANFSKNK